MRPSKVCRRCKSLKKKCDRKKPCLPCVKAHSVCIFDNWVSTVKEKNQKIRISAIAEQFDIHERLNVEGKVLKETKGQNEIKNPDMEDRSKDVSHERIEFEVNLSKTFSSISFNDYKRINYGPLSWPSLMKADFSLGMLEDFVVKNFQGSQVNEQKRKTVFDIMGVNKAQGTKKIGYSANNKSAEPKSSSKPVNNNPSLHEEYAHLIDTIKSILPCDLYLWYLIDHFFLKLYPVIPILDESEFRSNIEEIIKYEDSKIIITLRNKLDLAFLGLLLVLLRLTYCALFELDNFDLKIPGSSSSNESAFTSEKSVIAPVPIKYIEVSKLCLEEFNLSERSAVEVLQFVMFFKFYHRYAPETRDGVDECNSTVALSVVIHMAMSLGLNREPVAFPGLHEDKKRCHLLRKIWHTLYLWDIRQSCISGAHLIINPSHFDMKFPFYEAGIINVLDASMEQAAIKIFEFLIGKFNIFRGVLTKLLDLNTGIRIGNLISILSEFDEGITRTSAVANEYTGQTAIISSVEVITYFELKCCLACIYFLMYIQCYRMNDMNNCELFMFRCLSIITESMAFSYEVFHDITTCIFFVIPSIESIIQKSNLMLLSLIISGNLIEFFQCNSGMPGKKIETLQALGRLLHICADNLLNVSYLLSPRYCYSWQTFRAQKFLLGFVNNEFFLRDVKDCSPIGKFHDLEHFCTICQQGIDTVNKINSPYYVQKKKAFFDNSNRKFSCANYIPALFDPKDKYNEEEIRNYWTNMLPKVDMTYASTTNIDESNLPFEIYEKGQLTFREQVSDKLSDAPDFDDLFYNVDHFFINK